MTSSSEIERVLFVPDTHSPYEDKRAWRLMLQAAADFRPDTIVHLGDLADCYRISSHSKDPRRTTRFKQEVEHTRERRAELDALGASRKILTEGNHEDRLRRYLAEKAPELFEFVGTDDLLELTENGWEFYPYRETAKVGKLHLTHDVGGGGKYSTARALDTYQASVAIGHHHAVQYYVSGDAKGGYQIGAQFGWLGDIRAVDYMSRVKVCRTWALGFGIGYHEPKTGHVFVVPVPIVKYSCVVEGRLYKA